MSKKRSKRYSQAEREELMELYGQCGYSVWRFCREMNLSYDTLKRWLSERAPGHGLVEVTAVAGAPPERSSVRLSVRLPNGIVCELGAGLSREETLNWVRELNRC